MSYKVFGNNYHDLHEGTLSTQTGTTAFKEFMKMTVTVPAGSYRISWHVDWSHSAADTDFIFRVQLDDTTIVDQHSQEPKDQNSVHEGSGFRVMVLTAGTHFIDLDFATESAGDTASMHDADLEFWRVK